jgi:iron complex outermembrane recepter protein
VYGAELETRWLVAHGLTLDLGLSYLKTKIKEYMAIDASSVWPDIVRFDAAGGNLANAPKLQANAAVNYEWRLGDRLDMFFGADYAHKDAISGRTQDPISDYNLLNARVGVKAPDDHWSVTLWGRNLTNEYYWNAAFGSNGTYVRMNGMPVTWGVTIAARR